MWIKRFLIALCCLLFTLPSRAEVKVENINVVADEWSAYTNKDGTGYYFRLLEEVFAPKAISLNLKFVPFSRAGVMLRTNEADVLLGVYSGLFEPGWYSNRPVDIDFVDIILTKEKAEQWHGPESLEGLRLGSIFGNAFDRDLKLSNQYLEVKSHDALVKMLVTGRIDAIIGYDSNLIDTVNTLSLEGRFSTKRAVFSPASYFVFSGSEKGRELKQLFDQSMIELRASGKLREIMKEELGDDSAYAE